MEMTSGLKYDDEAARERQPKPGDELEDRIVEKLRGGLSSTEWASNAISQTKPLLINYFQDCLKHLDDSDYIHARTQEVLSQFAETTQSKIEEGAENLNLPEGTSVFLATNHLGTYKLLGIDPDKDLGHPEIGIPVLHPFPAFYGSLFPVASRLGDGLYQAAHDYPDPIRSIQMAAGSLVMPPGQNGTLAELEKDTKTLFEGRSNIALTLFPEGGTTGKRNNGGIYEMEKFRTGSFVIAGHLDVPVIPVAQYFDPNEGFKLKVFPVVELDSPTDEGEARDYFRQKADQVHSRMQEWLDQKQAS